MEALLDCGSLAGDFVVLGEPAEYIHMALSSNPSFSRAGRADTKTVWEPYRSCTNTPPLDYDRCVKEKKS